LSRAAFFFTLLLFFLPLFVSSGVDGALYSYAMAHGIQYIILVGILSVSLGASDGRRGVSRGMIALATLEQESDPLHHVRSRRRLTQPPGGSRDPAASPIAS